MTLSLRGEDGRDLSGSQPGDGAVSVLEVNELSKVYGSGSSATQAIADLSFDVADGEFLCIVGPSGCGKTTMLRTLAGLLKPTSGQVNMLGRPVDGPPPGLAMVFQEYTRSLFPWLSVLGNVMFPMRAASVPRAERKARAAAALSEVGLTGFEDHYPWQLSGGMQQRVAIARAVAYRPQVLLMDEPFASVDAQTRDELEDLLLRVQADTGVTILFVTHDIDEAIYLGQRVLVLTRRPTRVERVVAVDLQHPRDQITTKADPEFIRLRTEVHQLIRAM